MPSLFRRLKYVFTSGENPLNDNWTLHLHSPCTAAFYNERLEPLQITEVCAFAACFHSLTFQSLSNK